MSLHESQVEERLDHLANLYTKFDELIDQLPIELPTKARRKIKGVLFENQDMADLIEDIKHRRPPRFILVGRTGAGKSSLINALCGRYLAMVSDVKVGTTGAKRFSYVSVGKILVDLIDTRGLAESMAVNADHTAEVQLAETIKDFQPDAILFLTKCKERAYLDQDVAFLRSLIEAIEPNLPIIALLTQADEMEPSRQKDPREYPVERLNNISEAEAQLKAVLGHHGVKPLAVLAVSAYLEWDLDPKTLAPQEWPRLRIRFDGRYNINALLDILESNIDLKASIFLMLATRVNQIARKISERLTRGFTTAAMAISTSPIPLSDLYLLLALQVLLIMLIAYLAGHDMSYHTTKKLLVSLGGTGVVGLISRRFAQQATKLLNIFPGAGSVVSATLAGAGTYAIGRGAIRYFFDRISEEEIPDTVQKARHEFETNNPPLNDPV